MNSLLLGVIPAAFHVFFLILLFSYELHQRLSSKNESNKVTVMYFLSVIFNILNKKVYNYFSYPYFVSVIHLLVGVGYCLISWVVGLPKRVPIDKELLQLLTPVSLCHALGHVMSNVSFAAVAVSFSHTIKALEPFFNAAASQFVLGHQIPPSACGFL